MDLSLPSGGGSVGGRKGAPVTTSAATPSATSSTKASSSAASSPVGIQEPNPPSSSSIAPLTVGDTDWPRSSRGGGRESLVYPHGGLLAFPGGDAGFGGDVRDSGSTARHHFRGESERSGGRTLDSVVSPTAHPMWPAMAGMSARDSASRFVKTEASSPPTYLSGATFSSGRHAAEVDERPASGRLPPSMVGASPPFTHWPPTLHGGDFFPPAALAVAATLPRLVGPSSAPLPSHGHSLLSPGEGHRPPSSTRGVPGEKRSTASMDRCSPLEPLLVGEEDEEEEDAESHEGQESSAELDRRDEGTSGMAGERAVSLSEKRKDRGWEEGSEGAPGSMPKWHVKREQDCYDEATKRYNCDQCDTSFTMLGNLRRHKKSHEPTRPFNCIYCPKGFLRKQSYVEHLRLHTGEKPFVCSLCQMPFTRRKCYQLHQKSCNGAPSGESSTPTAPERRSFSSSALSGVVARQASTQQGSLSAPAGGLEAGRGPMLGHHTHSSTRTSTLTSPSSAATLRSSASRGSIATGMSAQRRESYEEVSGAGGGPLSAATESGRKSEESRTSDSKESSVDLGVGVSASALLVGRSFLAPPLSEPGPEDLSQPSHHRASSDEDVGDLPRHSGGVTSVDSSVTLSPRTSTWRQHVDEQGRRVLRAQSEGEGREQAIGRATFSIYPRRTSHSTKHPSPFAPSSHTEIASLGHTSDSRGSDNSGHNSKTPSDDGLLTFHHGDAAKRPPSRSPSTNGDTSPPKAGHRDPRSETSADTRDNSGKGKEGNPGMGTLHLQGPASDTTKTEVPTFVSPLARSLAAEGEVSSVRHHGRSSKPGDELTAKEAGASATMHRDQQQVLPPAATTAKPEGRGSRHGMAVRTPSGREGSSGRVRVSHSSSECVSPVLLQDVEQEKKLYRCQYCDIFFGNKMMFLLHRGLHGEANPLRCSLCQQVFHTADEFLVHH